MVDQGYQTFSVVLTSIIIALLILLLIIMFLDIIVNKGGITKESGFFKKLIYHIDIIGKIFEIRPQLQYSGGSLQEISSEISDKGQKGGCGSCNNFNLSSSLTYDPQIFLKKRNH